MDLYIGKPPTGPTGDAQLQFSMRLNMADGGFDGVVVASVDAAYFVSGYETSRMGEHGVLALLGTDGIFRVRRTGDSLFSGDKADYATIVPADDGETANGKRSISGWGQRAALDQRARTL